MVTPDLTSDDRTGKPSPDELLRENEELKSKLKSYESIHEELMAQKIFENAKKKFIAWITLGGIATVIVGVFGYLHIEELVKTKVDAISQDVVKKKVDTVSEQQISDLIRRIASDTVAAKEQFINSTIVQVVNSKLTVSRPLTYSAPSTPSAAPAPLVFDSKRSEVDYTAYMTPVRQQGGEGSVVGFAVAAVLEYQIFKKTKKQVQISPRYIYNAARKAQGTSSSDSGARLEDAIKVLTRDGAVAEEAWPYKAGEFAAEPPNTLTHAERYRPASTRSLKSIDDMRAALQKYGPVVAAITAYQSIGQASVTKTGYVPDPLPKDKPVGGHAICIVGYNDQKKVLKFRNSWGSDWGDHGYGYISYSYFEKFSGDSWAIIL